MSRYRPVRDALLCSLIESGPEHLDMSAEQLVNEVRMQFLMAVEALERQIKDIQKDHDAAVKRLRKIMGCHHSETLEQAASGIMQDIALLDRYQRAFSFDALLMAEQGGSNE